MHVNTAGSEGQRRRYEKESYVCGGRGGELAWDESAIGKMCHPFAEPPVDHAVQRLGEPQHGRGVCTSSLGSNEEKKNREKWVKLFENLINSTFFNLQLQTMLADKFFFLNKHQNILSKIQSLSVHCPLVAPLKHPSTFFQLEWQVMVCGGLS